MWDLPTPSWLGCFHTSAFCLCPCRDTVHGGMLLASIPSLVRLTGGTPRVWGAASSCDEVPVPGGLVGGRLKMRQSLASGRN